MTHTPAAFVQVGATRDGLDPYLDAARRRGMPAILVETPAYLRWRRQLGRRPFDVELPVAHPADTEEVRRALESHGAPVALVLAGFERYVGSAFAVAPQVERGPRNRWPRGPFLPVDKWGQRSALSARRPDMAQPRHASFAAGEPGMAAALDAVGYPQVVKPSNGGGGLGVFIAESAARREQALSRLSHLANYDGEPFERVLVEEYVEGREHSIQGLAHEGRALILTTCEKFITREEAPGGAGLRGFRESGHIATHGNRAAAPLRELTQACLDATGYHEGPFHVDIIQNGRGAFFIEMGFRLSGGGLVALVEKATGMKWAEMVFETHLGERVPTLVPERGYVGQVTAATEEELAAGERLRERGLRVDIQRMAPPPPAPEPGSEDETSLASDRLRHTGFAGRITLHGDSLEQVRDLLRGCIESRLGA